MTLLSPLQITPSWLTQLSPSQSLSVGSTSSMRTRPRSVSTGEPSAMQASVAIFPFCLSSPFTPCFSTGTPNIWLAVAQ